MGKLSNYLLEGLFLYFFITAENQTLSKLTKLPNFKDDGVKKIFYKKKLFKGLSIRSFCQFHRDWLFCVKVHASLPKHKTQRWTNNWFSKLKKNLVKPNIWKISCRNRMRGKIKNHVCHPKNFLHWCEGSWHDVNVVRVGHYFVGLVEKYTFDINWELPYNVHYWQIE